MGLHRRVHTVAVKPYGFQCVHIHNFSLLVLVDKRGLQIDDTKHISDNSTDTCATFLASKLQHTQVFKESYCNADRMAVTVVGRNMKCDEDLYVVGLTVTDVNKPLNRWKTCKHIWQATNDDNTEWCSYECDCSRGCEQVMLLRWPKTLSDSSWTLCDISEHCNGKIIY